MAQVFALGFATASLLSFLLWRGERQALQLEAYRHSREVLRLRDELRDRDRQIECLHISASGLPRHLPPGGRPGALGNLALMTARECVEVTDV